MRRSVLLTLAVLGGAVCLIGGVGLFAALTDTATTGTNSAESKGLAASADLQVAVATDPVAGSFQFGCGTFTENYASPLFTATNVQVGYQSSQSVLCVKNAGSQTVQVNVDVFELSDIDTACTGDEALNGDTTCGNDQTGELSLMLATQVQRYAQCDLQGSGDSFSNYLNFLSSGATLTGGSLAPGETACYGFYVTYPSGNAASSVQQAQSDKVTWRYRFNAAA